MTTTNRLPRPVVGRLTEPTHAEQEQFRAWILRHPVDLYEAYEAAERLAVAYDHAAIVTGSDRDPAVPAPIQEEINVRYREWEAVRWAGQRNHSGSF